MEDVDFKHNTFASVAFDFIGEQEGELTVKEGDWIRVIEKETSVGWSLCSHENQTGLVPTAYIKLRERVSKKSILDRKVRGKVIIQHSIHEHGGRYKFFAKELIKEGFAVFAMDLAGHGKSDGVRGYIESYADWVDEFATFYDQVNTICDGDTFIFGQGIGGNVALLFYLYHGSTLQISASEPVAIILSGCAFEFTKSFKKSLSKAATLSKLSPQTPNCEFNIDGLTLNGSCKITISNNSKRLETGWIMHH